MERLWVRVVLLGGGGITAWQAGSTRLRIDDGHHPSALTQGLVQTELPLEVHLGDASRSRKGWFFQVAMAGPSWPPRLLPAPTARYVRHPHHRHRGSHQPLRRPRALARRRGAGARARGPAEDSRAVGNMRADEVGEQLAPLARAAWLALRDHARRRASPSAPRARATPGKAVGAALPRCSIG